MTLEALGDLLSRERRALLRAAMAEGVAFDEAHDAIQDAAAMVMSKEAEAPDIRTLMVMVRNQARNARRTRARREALLTSLSPREEARALDEMLLVAEAHVQLTGCLLTLQELPRAVVTARLLDERTGDDVARELSLTPGHVAVLLHRARKRLESCMARFHEFTRQRARAAAS